MTKSALLFKNGLFELLAYCYLLCTERLFADYLTTKAFVSNTPYQL